MIRQAVMSGGGSNVQHLTGVGNGNWTLTCDGFVGNVEDIAVVTVINPLMPIPDSDEDRPIVYTILDQVNNLMVVRLKDGTTSFYTSSTSIREENGKIVIKDYSVLDFNGTYDVAIYMK